MLASRQEKLVSQGGWTEGLHYRSMNKDYFLTVNHSNNILVVSKKKKNKTESEMIRSFLIRSCLIRSFLIRLFLVTKTNILAGKTLMMRFQSLRCLQPRSHSPIVAEKITMPRTFICWLLPGLVLYMTSGGGVSSRYTMRPLGSLSSGIT